MKLRSIANARETFNFSLLLCALSGIPHLQPILRLYPLRSARSFSAPIRASALSSGAHKRCTGILARLCSRMRARRYCASTSCSPYLMGLLYRARALEGIGMRAAFLPVTRCSGPAVASPSTVHRASLCSTATRLSLEPRSACERPPPACSR